MLALSSWEQHLAPTTAGFPGKHGSLHPLALALSATLGASNEAESLELPSLTSVITEETQAELQGAKVAAQSQ